VKDDGSVIAGASVSVTYDEYTQVYTYDYVVFVGVGSANDLEFFGFQPVKGLTGVQTPPHWMALQDYQTAPNSIMWGVTDRGPTPVDWDGLTLGPSSYGVYPGGQLAGFQLQSTYPPDAAGRCFFRGWVEPLSDDQDDEGDPFRAPPPTVWDSSSQQSIEAPTGGISLVGTNDSLKVPRRLGLGAPLPNPSADVVWIGCSLPAAGRVVIQIRDVSSRTIRTLADESMEAGSRVWAWDGKDDRGRRVGPGIYYYDLKVDGQRVASQRLVRL
jgi:hypothetical protein